MSEKLYTLDDLNREFQKGYKNGHIDGCEVGWTAALQLVDHYFVPILNELNKCNSVMYWIRGTAATGIEPLRKKAIHKMSGELHKWIEITKQSISRAALELKDYYIMSMFKLSPAEEVLKAARSFYVTGDTDSLNILIAAPDEDDEAILAFATLRPGLLRRREGTTDWKEELKTSWRATKQSNPSLSAGEVRLEILGQVATWDEPSKEYILKPGHSKNAEGILKSLTTKSAKKNSVSYEYDLFNR